MARKKASKPQKSEKLHGVINGAGEVVEQPIVSTIRENFMPYAMSVILSRAIPEIDGFKPSHRKLLFTMYKMGLLNGARTKSANIVGATMKLNPHGDSAIYDTMVRLSRGYEALLHPYVDSKGNFGKFFSRDMAWAASRYTEAKLAPICNELFRDIDKDTVDFVDNYDNTMKEPSLLPTVFPSVLVNANTGIAVGMASNICSFNLSEICETTASLIRDPGHDLFSTLPAPDFSGGCQILYDEKAFRQVYETGRGSIRLRAKYVYDKSANCIDVLSIPASTTCEVIIEKIIDLVKQGKVREISDIRDETGLDGLKITMDLKRSTDPDKLMAKLFKLTTLEDSYACNFNVLIAGVPRVMGVRELINEWIAFRMECVKRRTYFELKKAREEYEFLIPFAKSMDNTSEHFSEAIRERLAALRPFAISKEKVLSPKHLKELNMVSSERHEFLISTGLLLAMTYPRYVSSLIKLGLTPEEIGLCALYLSGYSSKELNQSSYFGNIYRVNSGIRSKLGLPVNGEKIHSRLKEIFNTAENVSK